MTVLVVDEAPGADILCGKIAKEGYPTQVVHDNAAALQRLEEGGVQLLITELRARGIDGWDLLASARRVSPETHVVFLVQSASDEMEDVLRSLDVDAHLLKPVDEQRLQTILRALLHGDSLDRTAEAILFLPQPEQRAVVEQALTDAGIFGERHDDVRALSATLRNDPPNLLIVDIGPSCPQGFEACEAARRSDRYIPILAISERVTRDDADRAIRLNVNDLILEPLGRHDVAQSALRLLRQSSGSGRRPR